MVGNASGEHRTLSANAQSWARTRPLSDIRELTEPSLVETIPQKYLSDTSLVRSASLSRKTSVASRHCTSNDGRLPENKEPDRKNSYDTERYGLRSATRRRTSRTPSPSSPADNSLSSIYSIPPGSVPPRSSSRTGAPSAARSLIPPTPPLPPPPPMQPAIPPPIPPFPLTQRIPAPPSLSTIHPLPLIPQPPPHGSGNTIPRRGLSRSPLRHVAARYDPISHDTHRHIPSRTFIREPLSNDLLEFPNHKHPRITLGVDLLASIFVGGGSIEGTVQIVVDDAERIRHRRTLDIARISIDLLGLEEMIGSRRSVFLNLANELIDEDNPPPQSMVYSQEQIDRSDPFWHLKPSVTNLAFMMSLPLNVGPPPFQSKNARIRYCLCVSLLIRDHGRQYIVRTTEDVTVLSVYDPEKALVSLPSPLTASDEWIKPRETSLETVRVTAGLHRQVWVSGTSIYADVHIANKSRKTIKKIELQLERDILCYKHAAAYTLEKSAGQARIFDSNERCILSRSITKQGTAGWHGVPAHSAQTRTCDLEVPRGHATVKCGKYFEVRYFLNVTVSSFHTKLVSVQLPIVLIHMNSLDVVPNSVAQVAAAIEEKRTAHTNHNLPHHRAARSPPSRLTRRPSHSNSQPVQVQGRAFAAPRMQFLDRMRAEAEDLQELTHILDHSPRKYSLPLRRANSSNYDYRTPPSNRKGRIVGGKDMADLQHRLRHVRSNDTLASKSAGNHHFRGGSVGSQRAGNSSALGFRDAEVDGGGDGEFSSFAAAAAAAAAGGLGLGVGMDVPPFKLRLEHCRERQYRFGKKRSMERWKRGVVGVGVGGWLKGGGNSSNVAGVGGGGKDERERDGWV